MPAKENTKNHKSIDVKSLTIDSKQLLKAVMHDAPKNITNQNLLSTLTPTQYAMLFPFNRMLSANRDITERLVSGGTPGTSGRAPAIPMEQRMGGGGITTRPMGRSPQYNRATTQQEKPEPWHQKLAKEYGEAKEAGMSADYSIDRNKRFSEEIKDRNLIGKLYNTAKREVGNDPVEQQKFLETVFNRAQFSNKSVSSILDPRYGYGSAAQNPNIDDETYKKFSENVVGKVMAGSNLTKSATDNASNDYKANNPLANKREAQGATGMWSRGERDKGEYHYYQGSKSANPTKHGLAAERYQNDLENKEKLRLEQEKAKKDPSSVIPQNPNDTGSTRQESLRPGTDERPRPIQEQLKGTPTTDSIPALPDGLSESVTKHYNSLRNDAERDSFRKIIHTAIGSGKETIDTINKRAEESKNIPQQIQFDPNDPIGKLYNTPRIHPDRADSDKQFYKTQEQQLGTPFNYASTEQGMKEFGGPGQNIVSITTPSGKKVNVNAAIKDDAAGFLSELENRGYKINDVGAYNYRNKVGGSGLSIHSWGAAIDINAAKNPFVKRGSSSAGATDMPEHVKYLAMKYGFAQLGNDRMHFERVPPAHRKAYIEELVKLGVMKKDDPQIAKRIQEGIIDQKTIDNLQVNTPVPASSTIIPQQPNQTGSTAITPLRPPMPAPTAPTTGGQPAPEPGSRPLPANPDYRPNQPAPTAQQATSTPQQAPAPQPETVKVEPTPVKQEDLDSAKVPMMKSGGEVQTKKREPLTVVETATGKPKLQMNPDETLRLDKGRATVTPNHRTNPDHLVEQAKTKEESMDKKPKEEPAPIARHSEPVQQRHTNVDWSNITQSTENIFHSKTMERAVGQTRFENVGNPVLGGHHSHGTSLIKG